MLRRNVSVGCPFREGSWELVATSQPNPMISALVGEAASWEGRSWYQLAALSFMCWFKLSVSWSLENVPCRSENIN